MKSRLLLLVLGLAWLSATAAADPRPPYYSVQLSSNANRAVAEASWRELRDVPDARIEVRGDYFSIRVGAWKTREQAADALPALKARGFADAAVLRIVNASRWISPTPSAPAAAAETPAVTAATAEALEPPAPAAAVAAVAPASPAAPTHRSSLDIPPVAKDFSSAAAALDWQVHKLVATSGLARRDGYTYTMDVAALMLYAARRADQAFYEDLRKAAMPLVMNRAKDPFTDGFVVWRHRRGEPAEISGAAEALHLARALWNGAIAFGSDRDRMLALSIVEGYEKHAFELGGDWLVRKYYAFGSKVFASWSAIGSYLPDFLAEVERAGGRPGTGPSLSERSYGALERAVSDLGLLYPIIQPEVNQTYPGLDLDVYAPNNVLPAADSCEAAAAALRGRPKIARRVLAFASDRDRRDRTGFLYAYFDATTGERIRRQVIGGTSLACYAQLAAALEDRKALDWLRPLLLIEIKSLAAVPAVQEAPLYSAGPLLLAAEAMGAFKP